MQKRVREWKGAHGPAKEVMFAQEHRPGEMGLSDFTHFKQATITIGGQALDHLLYHYRLAYSGWQYVRVVRGGESFAALSEGLQTALNRSGGSPKVHRTDSLSAAYRNEKDRTEEDLTRRYEELCADYQMVPTRNNRGVAHENGAIESAHGYFKRRLHQALLLRGSTDFESVASYQQFIDTVIDALNTKCHERFESERGYLQPLPTHQIADYELLSVSVTCHSTITVRCVLYTVPSRLIGHRLSVHLYHDRLVGKTHLAAAISRSLVESGRRVKFTTAMVLVQQLQQAKADLVLPAFLSKLERYDLLVVDDLGYVKKSEVETSVLFELISHRYELKSLLITANQTFSAWDSIFADATMTVAAVDRLVHHATIIEIRQESFRQKTALSRSHFPAPNSPE